jgi:hypothetical protein
MGAGLTKDASGKPIEANATHVRLPYTATDSDLKQLVQHCKQLQSLDLTCCVKITDAGLQSIAGMQQLRALDIGGCKLVTDAGLLHLTRLPQLHAADLQKADLTRVTDAGYLALRSAQQKAKAAACSGAAPAAASPPAHAASKAQQQQAAAKAE